jgi:hypothetical protein
MLQPSKVHLQGERQSSTRSSTRFVDLAVELSLLYSMKIAFGDPKYVGVTQNLGTSRFLCEIVVLIHGHEQDKAHSIYFVSEAYL